MKVKHPIEARITKTHLWVEWDLIMQGNLTIHLTNLKSFLLILLYNVILWASSVSSKKHRALEGNIHMGKKSTCKSWHKQVDFQQFGWDIMGATGKCVSSVSHTLKLPQTAPKIKLRHHWLTARLSSIPKNRVVIAKFLVFPATADEDILQKSHRGLKVVVVVGGRGMVPSNQITSHHWIYGTCTKTFTSALDHDGKG